MNTNTTTTTNTNRYAVLGAELKRLTAELKAKKKEMVTAIRKLEAEYREYRKNVYGPARRAAYALFKESKVRGKKVEAPAAEVVKVTKAKADTKAKTKAKPKAKKVVESNKKVAAE